MFRRLLLLLSAISASALAVLADPVVNFTFSAKLAAPIANQDSVTGVFSIDYATRVVTSFSFATPVGVVDSTSFTGQLGGSITPDGTNLVNMNVYSPDSSFFMLLSFFGKSGLAFADTFVGGPLYAGPIQTRAGYNYEILNCVSGSAYCTPDGYSRFASGNATPDANLVPEPASQLLCGTTLLLCLARITVQRRTDKRPNSLQ